MTDEDHAFELAVDTAADLARRAGESLSDFLDGPASDFLVARELRRLGVPADARALLLDRLFAEN